MNFEYDKDVDAAYIYMEGSVKDNDVKSTIEVKRGIILDFDARGRLLGIEILNASKVLGKKALVSA